MNEAWINYYSKLASTNSNPVSQSGYLIDTIPLDESVFDIWIDHVQKHFLALPTHHLLDVGCGSGLFLRRFARFTPHLYGVEPSPELLVAAQQACPAAAVRGGDALNASFDSLHFDRIFCNSVFLLFDSLNYARQVISYFLDISAPSARIWVGDLPAPTPQMEEGDYRRQTKTTNYVVQHYPVPFFAKLCEELGVSFWHFPQDIPGKPSSAYRYDVMIVKEQFSPRQNR